MFIFGVDVRGNVDTNNGVFIDELDSVLINHHKNSKLGNLSPNEVIKVCSGNEDVSLKVVSYLASDMPIIFKNNYDELINSVVDEIDNELINERRPSELIRNAIVKLNTAMKKYIAVCFDKTHIVDRPVWYKYNIFTSDKHTNIFMFMKRG